MSNYKRISKLGSGAFATTFLVEEVGKGGGSSSADKPKQQLVMKRVPCKHMRAANAALQEVKVLLSCHHDGIVSYHDFFLDTDSDENIVICLVMEFCDAGDLWEKIAAARRAKAQLEPQMVAGWTFQLVSALRYLHARSILHRDIKPENVFLTDGGEVAKLGDFGLATATEDLDASSAKTQVGTPDYMAPEVLEGRTYSAPADIFSLGATVYAMVCASFPKMLSLHLGQGKPLDWPAASEAMADWRPLVEQMLQVDEAARPSLDAIALAAADLPAAARLEGVSLTAKLAATTPLSDALNASAAAGAATPAAAPAATPPPIPSRPSQPMATEVKHDQLVLLWEPPPKTDQIDAYRILAQTSGAGGFHTLLDDTESMHPIVRLDRLSQQTWYEFKVVALNAAGSSPTSSASQPIQTAPAPLSAAAAAARDAAAAAAANFAAELQQGKSPRIVGADDASHLSLLEREDPELYARYNQVKRDLYQWEASFETLHKRPPTDQEKAADPAHQQLIQRYKKLKHAKRRLARGSSAGLTSPPIARPPAATAPVSAAAGGAPVAPSDTASPASPQKAVHAPASAVEQRAGGGATSPAEITGGGVLWAEPRETTPVATRPPAGKSTPSSNKSSRGTKKSGKHKRASGGSAPSVEGGGVSISGSAAVASRTSTMTVSMKASHPSPRALGACEETFE